jgi:hypothetical protein
VTPAPPKEPWTSNSTAAPATSNNDNNDNDNDNDNDNNNDNNNDNEEAEDDSTIGIPSNVLPPFLTNAVLVEAVTKANTPDMEKLSPTLCDIFKLFIVLIKPLISI